MLDILIIVKKNGCIKMDKYIYKESLYLLIKRLLLVAKENLLNGNGAERDKPSESELKKVLLMAKQVEKVIEDELSRMQQ